jgi:tetratricopeptide (TPR) repeat protein/tRNA A-37 threonylcarbamoyl transferase component Bud32/TolB-like protein
MIGQTISHYRILEHIGGGGMGVVYKAQDLKLDRPVVLKFLPPELTRDPEAKQRFIHEAKAASALQHSNICVVHDIDETDDGQLFISMEYLEGETLKKKIARGPLKIKEAVEIAIQIARGLARAHEHRIVHRDIKPANIMITTDGTTKIIDFGVARLAGWTNVTRAGSTVGTVLYMSPEQGRGEDVDERADIWSFGIVFFEMLTGKPPFISEYENAVIYSILNEEAKPVKSLRPGVPNHVSSLIARCLNKDREARPHSMGEILALLEGRRRPLLSKAMEWWGRLPTPVRYVSPVFVLLVVALTWWLNRDLVSQVPRTEGQKWRVAIMPFDDLTQEKRAENWPLLIQAMMVDELTGTEEIGVVDATTLNWYVKGSSADPGTTSKASLYEQMKQANISYVVEGMLGRSDTAYVVRWTLTDATHQEVRLAPLEKFSGGEDITRVTRVLSRDILSFFHVSALMGDKEADLKPWLKNRTRNIASLEAFLQGSEYAYRNRGEARRFFDKAIALDSTFIPPRIWLLSSLLGEGRFDLANQHYQTLLRLDTVANPFEHALIRYAGASLQGDLPGQRLALKEALEYSPRNHTLLYLLGRVCYDRGDFEGAAEAFQPLVDMNWRYQGAYYMLGICYVQMKEFKEAREILEKSLPLEPVFLHTYALLSALDLHEGDSSASARNEKKYLVVGEENANAHDTLFYWLGASYASCNLFDRAIDRFHRAVSLDPKNARYHLALANAFYSRGSVDSSESELVRTLDLDPSMFEAYLPLGRVYESRNDRANAIRHYTMYLNRDSTSSDAREAQGRVTVLARDINHKQP